MRVKKVLDQILPVVSNMARFSSFSPIWWTNFMASIHIGPVITEQTKHQRPNVLTTFSFSPLPRTISGLTSSFDRRKLLGSTFPSYSGGEIATVRLVVVVGDLTAVLGANAVARSTTRTQATIATKNLMVRSVRICMMVGVFSDCYLTCRMRR